MSSAACTILGTAFLTLLLAGYLAQHLIPPPKPKIVGIDLGTTYSCVGVYHAGSGDVEVLKDKEGNSCIPSVVAFNGEDIVVGYKAVSQADHNPQNTIYDAKRFIGKHFTQKDLLAERARYPFKLEADEYGMVRYIVGPPDNQTRVTPQDIGSHVLATLRDTAATNLSGPVKKAVMSVPAEFSEEQRNFTKLAAKLAGLEVLRVISEPTAAALAYGLHKKEGVQSVMVVDLGGGTLDVSLLMVQGGMFLTQAMAGNNHLGGQDFNQRLLSHLHSIVEEQYSQSLSDPEDFQALRQATEEAKLHLTYHRHATVAIKLHSIKLGPKQTGPVLFEHKVSRQTFESLNWDLFKKVLEPIQVVLEEAGLNKSDIDEIVLVGGSTRIPKVRELIQDFFQKEPNVSEDPELAVVYGVAIQAGIIGGMWPLQVSAIELPTTARKIHVY